MKVHLFPCDRCTRYSVVRVEGPPPVASRCACGAEYDQAMQLIESPSAIAAPLFKKRT